MCVKEAEFFLIYVEKSFWQGMFLKDPEARGPSHNLHSEEHRIVLSCSSQLAWFLINCVRSQEIPEGQICSLISNCLMRSNFAATTKLQGSSGRSSDAQGIALYENWTIKAMPRVGRQNPGSSPPYWTWSSMFPSTFALWERQQNTRCTSLPRL